MSSPYCLGRIQFRNRLLSHHQCTFKHWVFLKHLVPFSTDIKLRAITTRALLAESTGFRYYIGELSFLSYLAS